MQNPFPPENNQILLKTAQNGTDFVGIKITESERQIIFPMGYRLSKENLNAQKIEKSERKQIFNLIKSIHHCTSSKKGERVSVLNDEAKSDFPIRAMLFIIEDFLDRNSYYTEKETLYEKNTAGKIAWNRTIKNIKPAISETGIAFLDFIIRKNRIQENQLITELHKYCVYKCFEIFGFLYTAWLPENGLLQESDVAKNRKYYAQFLQDKIDSTHLESNIELFSNMLDFIKNFDCESEIKNAAYGTNSFQVVWERLVDLVFGTVTQNEKEKYFYPASRWNFLDGKKRSNPPLRPDTIMIIENSDVRKCFIIDSKYYSYSMLREIPLDENEEETVLVHGSIPGTDSIQKQITYAQYVDSSVANKNQSPAKYRFAPENIWNVFVLPADNGTEIIQYVGSAESDWHDGAKSYHMVHSVTVDSKFLIDSLGKKDESLQKVLSNLIKTILSNFC